MIRLIIFLCISIKLFAEVEYEIIPLAPEGQELVASETWYHSKCLNEAGYAWKPHSHFIYHEKLGFTIIPIPSDLYDESIIMDVNNQGVAVGVLIKHTNYWEPNYERIFVYDVKTDEYYDLLEHFNSTEGCSNIHDLSISDSGEIVFRSDLRTYIYNLNNKTISIFTHGYIYGRNSKGQMIGGNKQYDDEADEFWFFDNHTFHSMGSLDKFKRWQVIPETLSQNGFVSGRGLNSYGEPKIFTWHFLYGLKEIESPKSYFAINAINNKGQVIGKFEIEGKRGEYDHAFMICPELGFMDLGVLEGSRESYANAINNQGQVVGNLHDKAFIWDIQHGMRDLNTLISKDAIGWKELSEARAINDSGYIVGTGNYYGVEQYFLLIPKK